MDPSVILTIGNVVGFGATGCGAIVNWDKVDGNDASGELDFVDASGDFVTKLRATTVFVGSVEVNITDETDIGLEDFLGDCDGEDEFALILLAK